MRNAILLKRWGENMGKTISKTDALIEMVKAFDDKDEKRSNKISSVISKSLREETRDQQYREFIEIKKDDKKLFPQKIRKTRDKNEADKQGDVCVDLEDGCYRMVFDEEGKVRFEKM